MSCTQGTCNLPRTACGCLMQSQCCTGSHPTYIVQVPGCCHHHYYYSCVRAQSVRFPVQVATCHQGPASRSLGPCLEAGTRSGRPRRAASRRMAASRSAPSAPDAAVSLNVRTQRRCSRDLSAQSGRSTCGRVTGSQSARQPPVQAMSQAGLHNVNHRVCSPALCCAKAGPKHCHGPMLVPDDTCRSGALISTPPRYIDGLVNPVCRASCCTCRA
jgi:hypothetical protein